MIKLNKFNVTDTETKLKARVHYVAGVIIADQSKVVTIYAKDLRSDLGKIFGGYKNDSDSTTDYFETVSVDILEDHPLYKAALERAA